uniref:translocation protein SEC62-like isoform X1 n=1 Tax=Styela clava TaxID=7725 RepID=UPI00193A3BD9|nr:translocation protein SEC62-like isoform X1 [Styela clava]
MAAVFALPFNENVGKKKLEEENKNDFLDECIVSTSLQTTKLDMEITKFLRFNVPRKSTVMQKQAVEYFLGNKAVDTLLESKWATRKKGVDQLFVCREDAITYLDELLRKSLFYRVEKIELGSKNKGDKNEVSKNKTDKTEQQSDKSSENKNVVEEVPAIQETTLRQRKKDKKTENTEDDKTEDSESNKPKLKLKAKDKKTKEKQVTKVKKRYKLIPHNEQKFFDSKDIYIWTYNPVSWKTIIMGIAVLLCVVAATLFPLWPPEVRLGVYYLSIAGGVFIGAIFGIALARSILWTIIWVFTGGNHHLWILPNLLADVGFWESFKPYYTYEYKGSKDKKDEDEEDDENEDEEEQREGEDENEENKEDGNVQKSGLYNEENQENESLEERKTDTGATTRSEASTERSGSES